MNFEKLNNDYYILYSFPYKKDEIFVCRDKHNLNYCYFKLNNENFCSVKSPALDAFLKPFTDDVLYEQQSDDDLMSDDFQTALKFAKLQALVAISDLDDTAQQHATGQLATVKFEIKNLEKQSGIYDPKKHIITINKDCLHSSSLSHIIFHEILHCMSNSFNNVGFKNADIKFFNNGKIAAQFIHSMINEAYTEKLAEDYIPTKYKFYPFTVHIFKALLKFCDEKELKIFYFNSDANSMVDYLATNFHQSRTDIIRISLLFDACNRCYEYANSNDKAYIKSNITASYLSLYNLVCKAIIDKLKIENNEKLNSLKFDDIFPYNDIPESYQKNMMPTRARSELFFEYYKKQKNYSINAFENFMFPVYQRKFVVNFVNDIDLPAEYPEKFKIFEIFQQVLGPMSSTFENSPGLPQNKTVDKQKLFARLFDKSRNYIPKDKKLLSGLIRQYLEINDLYDFDITKYMDHDIVIEIVSKRPEIFAKLCRNNIYFIYNYQKQLPQKFMVNDIFYKSLFHQLIKEKNKNGYEIVRKYFYSLDISGQKELLNDRNFWVNLKNSNILTTKQFADFKEEATKSLQENSEMTI